MKKISLILIAILFTTNITAQIVKNTSVKNAINEYIILAELSPTNKEDDFSILKKLNENSNVEYAFNKQYVDEFGNTHSSYQQTFNNIKIIGAGYTFHKNKKGNSFLNGIYLDPKKINNLIPKSVK
jgi:Zn-dependent metalloprotease